MPEPEDEALVSAYLAGDEAAFADIYRRFAPAIFGLAWRALGDRDQADDVVASTFAHAAARLGQLREPAKLRSWLFAVARAEMSHLVRSVVRERRRRERVATLVEGRATVPENDEAYAGELLALAREGLSGDDRTLLGLILGELSNGEIAEALGVTIGSLDTRKSRLYDRLRLSLEVYWVTRPGRAECSALNALIAHRKETELSRALCRAVERHCRSCELCEQERRTLDPFALLGAAPIPLFIGHLSMLPLSGGGGTGSASPPRRSVTRWSANGFPAPDRRLRSLASPRRRVIAATAAAVIALAVTLPLSLGSSRNVRNDLLGASASTTTTAASAPLTTAPSTTTLPATTATLPVTTLTTIATAHSPALHKGTTTTKPAVSAAVSPPVHHHTHKSPPVVTASTTTTSTTLAPGQLVLDTPTIAFGSTVSSATVAFHDPGAGLAWSATPGASWLSLSATSGNLATASAGQLTVTMNRATAPTGMLTASVTLIAGGASAEVAVTATEDAPPSVTPNIPSSIECVTESAAALVSAAAGVSSVDFELTLPGAAMPTDTALTLLNGVYSAPFGPYRGYAREYASWVIVATDGDGKTTTVPSPPGSIYLDC